MNKQSISVSDTNNEWLNAQVASCEYGSKSEVINDLIHRARRQQSELERVRAELISAEQSGFTDENPQELLTAFKSEARQDGLL